MPPDSPGRYFIARLPAATVAAVGLDPRRECLRRRCGTPTSASRAPTRRRRRSARPAAPSSASPSTSWTPAGWRSSRIPRAPPSASGRRRRSRARSSSTSTGSFNFNGLNTRDVAAAKAFYGAVFGWQTLELGGGVEMWRSGLRRPPRGRPAGHPQARRGDRRRRRASRTSSPRINPIADDQPEVPAHWSVTFAVDDADADRREGRRARRHGARPAVRRAVGPDDGARRPPGRDVHRQQVRPREQGPRAARGTPPPAPLRHGKAARRP